MSDFGSNSMNRKPHSAGVTDGWLICIIIVLVLIVGWLLSVNLDWKSKEIFNWVLFTLLAAVLSCAFSAITSYLSQKTEESKEKNLVEEIKAFFVMNTGEIKDFVDEKTDDITHSINTALEKSDLVCGKHETILRMLTDWSLEIGKIEEIRILAHNSDSFSEFFIDYFKDNDAEFKCPELSILIHNQDVNKNSGVIKDWCFFCKKNNIKLEIKKAKIERRSFFGMIIKFERDTHHRIGLIGFYKPQDDEVSPSKRYGVFSEDNSILEVLDEYFDHYFKNASVSIAQIPPKNGTD